MWRRGLALGLMLGALPALSGCAGSRPAALSAASLHAASLPDAAPFDPDADAAAMLAAAQGRAARAGRMVLVMFGANWCHDSRALAGWLETEQFRPLIAARYEVVAIDVGVPQSGDGRNLDIAMRLGVDRIVGTPALLVLGPDGKLLNSPEDARSWRNAASRSGAEILAKLSAFARLAG